jgi:hypothetical protein
MFFDYINWPGPLNFFIGVLTLPPSGIDFLATCFDCFGHSQIHKVLPAHRSDQILIVVELWHNLHPK